jgi:methylated-DNA-[protein]-cysteine S-methyltransferase
MRQLTFDAVVPSPFGAVGVIAKDDFVTTLTLLANPQPEQATDQLFVQSVVRQLKQYFAQADQVIDIPIAVKGTPFQRLVWQAISAIPVGKTITYSELAKMVNSGPRAVANACGANQVPLVIPCHRVVAKQGLGGFMQGEAQGLVIKAWLLQHEQKC